MSAENTVHALLRGLRTGDPREWHLRAARCAWVKQVMAKLRAAQKAMDGRCDAAVDRLSEEEFERLVEEEQAKADVFLNQVRAAALHDKWPAHLYLKGA